MEILRLAETVEIWRENKETLTSSEKCIIDVTSTDEAVETRRGNEETLEETKVCIVDVISTNENVVATNQGLGKTLGSVAGGRRAPSARPWRNVNVGATAGGIEMTRWSDPISKKKEVEKGSSERRWLNLDFVRKLSRRGRRLFLVGEVCERH